MRNICVLLGVVVVGVAVLSPSPAQAIPPFAREYGVPCSTCHITVTRRNEFGDAFRRAGYRWPTKLEADAEGRPIPPVEMRGASMFDGLLPARPPIGVIFNLGLRWDEAAEERSTSLGTPAYNFVFGMNLGKHVSVLYTPSELYAHFGRIANRRELNLRVGLFEPTTTVFRNNEGLLGPYLIGSANPARVGAEINGVVAKRFFYALGTSRNPDPTARQAPLHGYYHVGMRVGGMSYGGDEPDIDFDNPSFWDDASISVSHWGYMGKDADGKVTTGRLRRYGLDLQFNLPFGSLWGGVMGGWDKDFTKETAYDFTAGKWLTNKSLTWFAEATYRITAYLTAAYIYQYRDASNIAKGNEIESHDVGLIALLMDNLRMRLKANVTPDDVKNTTIDLDALIGF